MENLRMLAWQQTKEEKLLESITQGVSMATEIQKEAVESQREAQVDPNEWYEHLLAQGHEEVRIQKIALTKMHFAKKDEQTSAPQDKTSSSPELGEIILQNVDEDGNEHPGEGPYPFKTGATQRDRLKNFRDTYEPVQGMPSHFRKKENKPVVGIRVPETKRIKSSWSPDGAEMTAGGYLIRRSPTDCYPINPESLWGYVILNEKSGLRE